MADAPSDESDYPWQLLPKEVEALSADNRDALRHAELFSLAMHGAALLYNQMLAQAAQRPGSLDSYAAAFRDWAAEVESQRSDLAAWAEDLEALWKMAKRANPRVPGPMERRFVERWVDRVLAPSPHELISDDAARAQVAERERRLKGPQARLGNPSALEAWGGASGSNRLSFRWGVAQTMLFDIHDGLAEVNEEAADVGS
jgi:hypothetical protein